MLNIRPIPTIILKIRKIISKIFEKLLIKFFAKIAFFEILFSDFFENEGNKFQIFILSALLARLKSLFQKSGKLLESFSKKSYLNFRQKFLFFS